MRFPGTFDRNYEAQRAALAARQAAEAAASRPRMARYINPATGIAENRRLARYRNNPTIYRYLWAEHFRRRAAWIANGNLGNIH